MTFLSVMSAVSLHALSKSYRMDSVAVTALSNINLEIPNNQFTVLSGPSGSGKTSLLNLIGALDQDYQGRLLVAGQDLAQLNDQQLSDFRNRQIGFIFQHFNLLPVLSAAENIEYPMIIANLPAKQRKTRVDQLLQQVGIQDRRDNLPGQLSGGQRQRVAIARALALMPKLVLADEPTANLDSQTGQEIIALMRELQRQQQVCFVFSSHDPQVLAAADFTVYLRDGRILNTESRGKV